MWFVLRLNKFWPKGIMDAGLGKQTGDVVSSQKSSAQEEYFRYMLLQAKLENLAKPDVNPILKVQSEREAIEMSILENLIQITESSPEFAQIADITGSRDRYEQARVLSEVVYDKVRAENILGFYTPSRDALQNHFITRTNKATDRRTIAGQRSMDTSLRAASIAFSATAGASRTLSAVSGGAIGGTPGAASPAGSA